MSMEIGGVDLILPHVPRRAYSARAILTEVAEAWPDSVIEGSEEAATRPVADILQGNEDVPYDEFFVYRNEASARDWKRKGATARNGNNMLHFLVRGAGRPCG